MGRRPRGRLTGAGPEVHLHNVCWNEAELLGFFFRHYDPWVDRYVIVDDGSTDGTLDLLHAHPKVEVRSFECRSDSFVYAQTDYLGEQRAAGATLVPGLGFGMVHGSLPPDDGRLVDAVRRGRPRAPFNKLGIFDPDAVEHAGIGHGRHVAEGLGIHYFMTPEERRDFWVALEEESQVLAGPGFAPDAVARGPVWWDGLPRVRTPG